VISQEQKKSNREARKAESKRLSELEEDERNVEDMLAECTKKSDQRALNTLKSKVRIARHAAGYGIGQALPSLEQISAPDTSGKSVLQHANELLTKHLPEDGGITDKQFHMYVHNSVPIVGDVLKYYKSNAALSSYQLHTRDAMALLCVGDEDSRYSKLEGLALEAAKAFAYCWQEGPIADGAETSWGLPARQVATLDELLGEYVPVKEDDEGSTVLWGNTVEDSVQVELSAVGHVLYMRNFNTIKYATMKFNSLLPSRAPGGGGPKPRLTLGGNKLACCRPWPHPLASCRPWPVLIHCPLVAA